MTDEHRPRYPGAGSSTLEDKSKVKLPPTSVKPFKVFIEDAEVPPGTRAIYRG